MSNTNRDRIGQVTCIPLSNAEITSMRRHMKLRDEVLFMLGIRTGLRISELLSVRVSDVYEFGAITDFLDVRRKSMKKKTKGRRVPLNQEIKTLLLTYITSGINLVPEDFLFKSPKNPDAPITRVQAYRIIKKAAAKAIKKSNGIGTHSMRKTYARRLHKYLNNDVNKTRDAMGHASITSTQAYLGSMDEEIIAAMLKD